MTLLLFPLAVAVVLSPSVLAAAQLPMGLVLPTDNRWLFTDKPWNFYMYTNRSFEGTRSTPWQGGQFGFVRNQKRISSGVIMTKFHEGVDIKPAKRSSDGTPLDVVRSIAAGEVVHTSHISGQSSYGKYVIIRHEWGYGPFYSLYAHLMTISVKPGQEVRPGTPLGRLGYTGVGIDKTRAHLHLELNMMLNWSFERWHDRNYRTPNYHGRYNGLNLVGLDISGILKAHRANPNLALPDFIARMSTYYKVIVPNRGPLEIVKRYPWLQRGSSAGSTASWEISMSRSGVPLAVEPSRTRVTRPTVSWVKYSSTYHSYHTRSRLSGSGSKASLTNTGERFLELVTGQF